MSWTPRKFGGSRAFDSYEFDPRKHDGSVRPSFDTEPNVVVFSAFAVPDVAIEVQELVICHLGLIVICNYATCIHNFAPEGHFGRSEHL